MADLKAVLTKLQQSLNTLREREAKYGGNAPLELLNQITDHQEAIALTEQTLTGQLSKSAWREALQPLLIAIQARSGDETGSSVSLGDIGGSIQDSTIAGRDVNQITVNVINLLSQTVIDPNSEPEPAVQALKDLVLKQVSTIDARTAQRYPHNPMGYTDPLRDALTELIAADRGLAARLEALLAQYEQAQPARSGDVITLSGTGNISHGTGHTSVTATGSGIAIGSVGGDVQIGPQERKQDD